ncbi:hypothetical protein BS78_02G222300 [Paspalum vaginatum]|nr:hypothetical protein BS78_02G222300 [Paspalum vaginatum]
MIMQGGEREASSASPFRLHGWMDGWMAPPDLTSVAACLVSSRGSSREEVANSLHCAGYSAMARMIGVERARGSPSPRNGWGVGAWPGQRAASPGILLPADQ